MEIYTKEDIEHLIKCPKIIVKPPQKDMKIDRGSYKNDMELKSTDDKHKFSVFMRQSKYFQEGFSIGLRLKNTTHNLFRCNGIHDYIKLSASYEHHFSFHIHKAITINNNDYEFDKIAEKTDDYASYEEALIFFINYINIIDANKYFNMNIGNNQLSLFAQN